MVPIGAGDLIVGKRIPWVGDGRIRGEVLSDESCGVRSRAAIGFAGCGASSNVKKQI